MNAGIPSIPRHIVRLVRESAALTCFGMLAVTLLGGCAVNRSEPPPLRASASERGPLVGLELITWVAGDPVPTAANSGPNVNVKVGASKPAPGVPEEVLALFADRPVPFAKSSVDAWRACGVGIVSIPVSELNGVRERLALAGPVETQQVPLSPRWIIAVNGSATGGPALITLDNGSLRVDRSQARLLVRSWAVPGEAETGGRGLTARVPGLTQLQFVPQLATATTSSAPRAKGPNLLGTGIAAEETKGQLLSRLQLEAVCGPGAARTPSGPDGLDAIVFFPLLISSSPADSLRRSETPGVGDATDVHSSAESGNPPPSPAANPTTTRPKVGPDVPEPPRLGEVLLSDAFAASPRRLRTILVVIPHPPKDYRLLE